MAIESRGHCRPRIDWEDFSDMKTVYAIIIAGDARMDEMVHAFDVFESWKVFASIDAIEIDMIDDLSIADALISVRKAYVKAGLRVVAVFVPNDFTGAWVDESVRAISDGRKWSMLDAVLNRYGFVRELEPIATGN